MVDGEINSVETFKLRVLIDVISKTYVGAYGYPVRLYITRRRDDDSNFTSDPRDCAEVQSVKLTQEHVHGALVEFSPLMSPGRYTLSLRGGHAMIGSIPLPSQGGKVLIELDLLTRKASAHVATVAAPVISTDAAIGQRVGREILGRPSARIAR